MALDTRDCQLLLCHQLTTICFDHQSISFKKKTQHFQTQNEFHVKAIFFPSNFFQIGFICILKEEIEIYHLECLLCLFDFSTKVQI